MIAVDTTVLAYLLFEGDLTPAAEALYQRDPEWAVPLLWRSEFRNVLAGCMRRGDLGVERAIAIQAQAEQLVADSEYATDSESVLRLVAQSMCSAYDCEFVSVAVRLGVMLVTADAKVRKAFPQHTVNLSSG